MRNKNLRTADSTLFQWHFRRQMPLSQQHSPAKARASGISPVVDCSWWRVARRFSSALLANNLAVSINGQIYTPISSRGRLTRGGCMDGNNDADTWRASTRQTKPFLSLSLPLSPFILIPLSSCVCLASTKARTSARIKLNHNQQDRCFVQLRYNRV